MVCDKGFLFPSVFPHADFDNMKLFTPSLFVNPTQSVGSSFQQCRALHPPLTNAKRWIFLENLSVFLDRMADDSHSGRMRQGSWLQRGNGMVAVCMGFGEWRFLWVLFGWRLRTRRFGGEPKALFQHF